MRFLSCILLFLTLILPTAATPIDTIFIHVPMSELPLLKTNPRLDMLDLYNYKMVAKGENTFGLYSVLQKKTPDYLRVKLTDISQWELMRLRADSSEIYACTHSFLPPVSESRITFYNTSWQPIDSLSLPIVSLEDFWKGTDSLSTFSQEELRRKLYAPIIYMEWETESDTPPTLQLHVSTDQLDMEARKEAEHCLKPLRLQWNGRRFVRS